MAPGLTRALASAAAPALEKLTKVFEKQNLRSFEQELSAQAEGSVSASSKPDPKPSSSGLEPKLEPPAAVRELAVSLRANPFNPEGGMHLAAGTPAANAPVPPPKAEVPVPAPALAAPALPAPKPQSAQERVLQALPAIPQHLRSQITETGLFRFGDMEINPSLVREMDPYTGSVHFQYWTPGGLAVNPNMAIVDPETKVVS